MDYKEIYDIVWGCFLTSYQQDEQWNDEETAKLIARKIEKRFDEIDDIDYDNIVVDLTPKKTMKFKMIPIKDEEE